MFGKLFVIIVALGATACVLLVNRQQRLDIAHEMARAHRQTLKNERAILDLRRRIAHACTPERVRVATKALHEEWEPIPARKPPAMAAGRLDAGGAHR
jgi:hypothetical protein